VLTAIFKIADDQGLLLLDLKDLRALVEYVGTNAREFRTGYGNISVASVGAIQRGLLMLEHQGAEEFFGEPALDLDDLLQTGEGGRGVINILAADRLYQSPRVYSTLLLWILSELFENLPEVGDRDKPVLVFFFDEAHLLFDGAPRSLLEKVEQVVRLGFVHFGSAGSIVAASSGRRGFPSDTRGSHRISITFLASHPDSVSRRTI